MKKILLLIILLIYGTANAKVVALLCETMVAAQRDRNNYSGPGSQYNIDLSRDASYSTWSVVIETDEDSKIKKVTVDEADKEFEKKGDLLSFKGKFLTTLEINLKTGRARTTITGFDTKEQGACKIVAKSEKGLLE